MTWRPSEGQVRRLWALAYEWARLSGLSTQDAKDAVRGRLKAQDADSPEDLDRAGYDAVCAYFEDGES